MGDQKPGQWYDTGRGLYYILNIYHSDSQAQVKYHSLFDGYEVIYSWTTALMKHDRRISLLEVALRGIRL